MDQKVGEIKKEEGINDQNQENEYGNVKDGVPPEFFIHPVGKEAADSRGCQHGENDRGNGEILQALAEKVG